MDELEKLLVAAQRHGLESDPDHEVGDLQDILRSCWRRMTRKDQLVVYSEHKEKLDEWFRR